MPNYLNDPTKSRGIRNNNPGNLRRTKDNWDGKIPFTQSKDPEFEQFREMRFGVRAMMIDLMGDIQDGKTTVSALINEYAPSFENNTAAYIKTVTDMIGISLHSVIELDEQTLIGLCKAMVYVENGRDNAKLVTNQDYLDAIAILNRPIKKKVKPCPCCGQPLLA